MSAPATDAFGWDGHPATWVVLAVLVVLTGAAHHRRRRADTHPVDWPRRQVLYFCGAIAALVVGLTWPVADLADHWSLTILMVQRLLLVLVAAPLLLLGLPDDLLSWLTRPSAVDALLVRFRRPAVAITTVTVVLVGASLPVTVAAQAAIPPLRALLTCAVLVAGVVLWLPVVGRVPGIPRLPPIHRLAYLAGQGVIPAFLSFALILAPRPLYPTFAGSHLAIGLRALNDQQIAGFVSKLGMLVVLLSVGTVALLRADEHGESDDPLVWADVQRQFERADRQDVTGPAP